MTVSMLAAAPKISYCGLMVFKVHILYEIGFLGIMNCACRQSGLYEARGGTKYVRGVVERFKNRIFLLVVGFWGQGFLSPPSISGEMSGKIRFPHIFEVWGAESTPQFFRRMGGRPFFDKQLLDVYHDNYEGSLFVRF